MFAIKQMLTVKEIVIMNARNKRVTFLSVIIMILTWKIASLVNNNEALLPAPEIVFFNLFALFQSPDFQKIVGFTIIRGLIGFFLSLLCGIIFGSLAGLYEKVEKSLYPILVVLKSTPIMSIILLLLLWFGTEKTPVFAGFLVAFPIIYTNVMQGTKNVDTNLVEMSRVYGVNRFNIIKDVYFPATAPYLFAGISTAFSIGWKVTVGAEVISQPAFSVGSKMWEAKLYIEIDDLLAWTVLAIILSYIIEGLIKIFERKIVRWKYEYKS